MVFNMSALHLSGTLRCYSDIIIVTGKWAKDSGLSRCFSWVWPPASACFSSVAVILSERIASAHHLLLGFIEHIIKLLLQVN